MFQFSSRFFFNFSSFKPDTTIPFQSWVVFEAQSTCKCVCFRLGAEGATHRRRLYVSGTGAEDAVKRRDVDGFEWVGVQGASPQPAD